MGEQFFEKLSSLIEENSNKYREAKYVELIYSVATEELSNFIQVNSPNQSLLLEQPIYSNIENKLDNGIFNEQEENNHLKKLIQMIINTNTLTGFILPQINGKPLYSEAKSWLKGKQTLRKIMENIEKMIGDEEPQSEKEENQEEVHPGDFFQSAEDEAAELDEAEEIAREEEAGGVERKKAPSHYSVEEIKKQIKRPITEKEVEIEQERERAKQELLGKSLTGRIKNWNIKRKSGKLEDSEKKLVKQLQEINQKEIKKYDSIKKLSEYHLEEEESKDVFKQYETLLEEITQNGVDAKDYHIGIDPHVMSEELEEFKGLLHKMNIVTITNKLGDLVNDKPKMNKGIIRKIKTSEDIDIDYKKYYIEYIDENMGISGGPLIDLVNKYFQKQKSPTGGGKRVRTYKKSKGRRVNRTENRKSIRKGNRRSRKKERTPNKRVQRNKRTPRKRVQRNEKTPKKRTLKKRR